MSNKTYRTIYFLIDSYITLDGGCILVPLSLLWPMLLNFLRSEFTNVRNKLVFVPNKLFELSLMFVGNVRSFITWVRSAHKHYTRLERLAKLITNILKLRP